MNKLILFLCLLLWSFSSLPAALSGIYTINPAAAASASNYLTFASAISDMASGVRADGGAVNGPAVSGAVTFNVSAATFNERVTLPAITGASATNTVTFNGAGAAATILTWNSTAFNDYTWLLNGADFIRIQNMRIENTGATEGYGIMLLAQANNNIISNCTIALPVSATGNNQVCISAASSFTTLGNNANNLTIQNNTLIGGRIGIVHNGIASATANGVVIQGNTLTENHFAGFYFQHLNSAQVIGNSITLRQGNTGSYGSQMRNCDAFTFTRNLILNAGFYGGYWLNCNVSTTGFAEISNNMVGGLFQGTGTVYGFYFGTCNYLQIFHNSVYVNHNGSTSRGIQLAGQTAAVEILNNAVSAVANTGTGAVSVYLSSTAGLSSMNNNMYHSNGTNLVFLATGYPSLPALQAGQPGFNSNSQSGWPNFVSATDLHTFGVPLSNWAAPIGGMNIDFDLQARPLAPDVTPDVGADEFVLVPTDPDLLAITSPLVAAVGNNTFAVRVQNNGASSLNGQNLSLQYSVDGGLTWPVTEVFVPTTLGTPGSQQVFTFSTPWVVAAPGSFNICVRIGPNMPGDPDPVNQVCLNICTGLNGIYSINNTVATGGTNYNSFADAVAALGSCGISAPVTFLVAPGTYIETFTLPEIAGASATNTVTFDGGNATTTRIFFNHTVINSAIITLNGTDHVTFRNLSVEVPGIYGFCFHLKNGANFNRIENCNLLMDVNSTSVYQIGVLLAGNTYTTAQLAGNFNTVEDCYIRGGYYGVRMNGLNTTTFTNGNKVIGCELDRFYFYGIYSLNQRAPEFSNNHVHSRAAGSANATTSSYGYYLSYADSSFRLVNNRIYDVGAYGIYITNGNRQNNGRGLIENNMIGGGFQTSGTANGVYLTSVVDTDIRSNSIHIGAWTGHAMYVLGSPPASDSLRIVNNIFSAGGAFLPFGGTALRVSNAAAVKQLNYNLYYAPNGPLGNYGGITYTTMAAWNSAYPALNQNSVAGFPGFRNETDLHIVCSDFDNLGTPSPVTVDYDGQARNASTPDIGADEFTTSSISVSLGADTSICGTTRLTVDSSYIAFFWDGFQGTNSIPVNNSGTFTVAVIDSNNCRATDSIAILLLPYPVEPYGGDTIAQCSYDSLDALNPGMTYLWSTGDTNQITYPGLPGLYHVDITSADGCVTTDSVLVVLFADALAQLGNDTTFCTGGGVVLNAGNGPTGTQYAWNNGINTQVLLVSAAGMYAVTVSSPNGCIATDSVNINILLSPVASLGANRIECDQFTLDPGNTPGGTYQWNTGPTTQTISGTATGTYTVTVTSSNGCQTIDQVQITVATSPTVNLGQDRVICDGQSVNFSAGNPGSTYLWSTGASGQSINVNQPGTYIVTVTNPSTQCTGTDEVTVTASIVNVNLGPNTTLCQGESYLLDAGFGPNTYGWSTGANTQTIGVNQPGTYSVSVTDALGCVARDSITLTGAVRPAPAFSSVTSAPLFQPIQFNDQSNGSITSWHWDFGDGQTSVAQNPSYTYLAMGTFTVCLTVTNATCDSTVCTQVTIGAPVEVTDAYLSQYVQVYPNPSDGDFAVAFDLPQGLDLDLEVIDLAGQRVLTRSLRGVRNQAEALDIRDRAAGVYFLRIRSSKGHQMIAKLVKL